VEKARGAGASVSSSPIGDRRSRVAPRASRNTRKFEPSCEECFGQLWFTSMVTGCSSRSAGTHGAADQSTFATRCGHADQRAGADARRVPM
jgi:hypothetical protein